MLVEKLDTRAICAGHLASYFNLKVNLLGWIRLRI